jgi:ABC-type transport system substrate-binding protein
VTGKNPHYFKKDFLRRHMSSGDEGFWRRRAAAGEIRLHGAVPIQQLFILENSPGIQVVSGPEMAPVVALMNMRVKPFDDVRIRRAVGGFGIDRFKIAKLGFGGRAQPLVSVLASGVPDAIDLNDMYPYRPEEAKRLLEGAGVRRRTY